jgi:hypothetical protein
MGVVCFGMTLQDILDSSIACIKKTLSAELIAAWRKW